MHLLILGARGATGRAATALAAAEGHSVRAADISWEGAEPAQPGVERIEADILSGDLAPAMRGVEAVISALGVPGDPKTLLDPPPLYTDGTRRVAEAMQAEGVSRLVTISASWVATTQRGPLLFRTTAIPALHQVIEQMKEMEAYLRASPLDWTAVRPGWLMPGEVTGDYWTGPDMIPEDMIRTRHGDLAHFMLHCATTGAWSRATPAVARKEPEEMGSNVELVKEMLA
ncbi:NAD(P)-dependent oxidoreductase [Pseudoroseicyclus aestuarii]|uniref:Putative NAD(P)-binding protein n=1 Tax=Pseudoroseicyclus aestuarii TaxID=1795041 RepID=A0A318SWD0_9RHOB|nr:NAD(P)H-binding protein [Pseudoroseicyclus aestuarii]PYE85812.1 putative NAD(P)-binding protein [Pseudoroseicyclus aestuarii]